MAAPGPPPSGAIPLRPAMSMARDSEDALSPRSSKSPPKVVSIAEPENISPLMEPLDGLAKKQYTAGVAKRLSGRPSQSGNSSRLSLQSQKSMEDLPEAALPPSIQGGRSHSQHRHHRSKHDKLLTQVAGWLQAERTKLAARKAKKTFGSKTSFPDEDLMVSARPSSQGSDSSAVSLEKLQKILEDNMADAFLDPSASPSMAPRRPSVLQTARRKSSARMLVRMASSDTEYQEGDVVVPSCDVVLDNSKTLSYSGGGAGSSSELNLLATSKRIDKERNAWSTFKAEILRLAHTLRLKGWRRISLDSGDDIDVERLSGALTNAVYVVSPPKDLPQPKNTSGTAIAFKKPPPKLLLRIYGPQVEHLIDRENELGILRRLARKKIGPRLLGTFRNGRFEEYFDSTTLTAADLRVSETSKQIAKRMRELHDGVELLEQERDDGPFVWRNWDKWVDRCELVIKYLDDQILSGKAGPAKSKSEAWKARGLICGVEWPVFRAVIDKYRQFLIEHYGGAAEIRKQLVFAHNDTQYGNILRLRPSGESPLLLPANSHKQLVVIDFEYASANTPGLEFANHFTEWCYNYHDPVAPHACNTAVYPTESEQRQFIRSYINHRPQFNPLASATPKSTPSAGPGTSISDFLLDSRTPGSVSSTTSSIGNLVGLGMSMGTTGGDSYAEEEAQRERQTEIRVRELMKEARLWRVANSAQWVAWGIVQAKVPELDGLEAEGEAESNKVDEEAAAATAAAGVGDDEEEFDYLGYAQERAQFFWGDVVALGFVKVEELSEGLRARLKVVPY